MKTTHRTLLLVLILLLVPSTAVAQQSTTNATPAPGDESTSTNSTTTVATDESNQSALLVVDDHISLVEKRYDRDAGVLHLTFKSDAYLAVSLVAPTEASGETGTSEFRTAWLDPGTTTRVTIPAPPNSKVWLLSAGSRDAGKIHHVRTTPPSSLIGGPWTGTDVRDAALGGALAIVIAMLDEAIAAKIGLGNGIERLA